jgi:hypothetical protein
MKTIKEGYAVSYSNLDSYNSVDFDNYLEARRFYHKLAQDNQEYTSIKLYKEDEYWEDGEPTGDFLAYEVLDSIEY